MQFLESALWRRVARRENAVRVGLRAKFVVFFLRCYGNPGVVEAVERRKAGDEPVSGILDSRANGGRRTGVWNARARSAGEERMSGNPGHRVWTPDTTRPYRPGSESLLGALRAQGSAQERAHHGEAKPRPNAFRCSRRIVACKECLDFAGRLGHTYGL
jgi:hypothetical protein